jgi:hypothetical protein
MDGADHVSGPAPRRHAVATEAVGDGLMLDSGPGDPARNMALDEALLLSMPRLQRPVLRFYSWTEPAATFGYFQKMADVERLTALRPLVRRPTGGGVVPHDADWTYSLAFPTGDPWYALRAIESYRRVHAWLQAAFSRLGLACQLAPHPRHAGPGQCFVGYETSDLLCRGRKIAGAAQRRTRDGLLIQGSIQCPVAGLSRSHWQHAMCAGVPAGAVARWQPLEPDAALLALSEELAAQKYRQAGYNRRR